MKTISKISLIAAMLLIFSGITMAQSGWRITVNNDHSPFNITTSNNTLTFIFNPNTDTLVFSLAKPKALKDNFQIEFVLKNNNKTIFTTNEKFLNFDRTKIVVPLSEVWADAKATKIPKNPKFILNIKDKAQVRETIPFEFKE